MKHSILFTVLASALILGSCNRLPDAGTEMFPDYTDITIPCNIAPLNFRIDAASSIGLTVKGAAGEYTFKAHGQLMKFPEGKWHQMLEAEKGNTLEVSLVWKNKADASQNGVKTFTWTVSKDSIDPYMSYRLIEPAYEVWHSMQIAERSLESFKVKLLGDNMSADQCCMNCHTSNRNGTSFMHLRGAHGGTILNRNGKISKLDTKVDETITSTVYGDISPDGRYGVFAAANIVFAIHTHPSHRMEVYDNKSDLVVVDFDNLTITDSPAVKGEEWQETFPCFSPDGKVIFYCRARHLEQPDSTNQMMYDIAAVEFDPETGIIGDSVITVVSSSRHNTSFSHLKCAPDGRFLLATIAAYGTFPIWHPESSLCLIDLSNGRMIGLDGINSQYAETYHSWSSNSRWITYASKADDKVYGRPYFTHIDENGRTTKPFVLPQKDPSVYRTTLKSFNLPELYSQPEQYNARDVARIYNKVQTEKVTYKKAY